MISWKKVKLGSLLTESKVISNNPSTQNRLRVKLNMLGIEKRPNTSDKEGATKYYIRKAGQFIYGKQNLHKGAFGIVPEQLDGFESSSDIPAFDVDTSCYPEWIYYFFKKNNFYSKLEVIAKGVGSKRIQPSQIFDLDIYLPDKNEQKKILDHIISIENKHKAILLEIERQEKWLSDFRKEILNDAVKGKITEDWRNQNPHIEYADILLNRLKKEKVQVKENSKRRDTLTNKNLKLSIPYDLPESWVWCHFYEIATIESNLVNPEKYLTYPHIAPDSIEKDNGVLLSFNKVEDDNLISAKHFFYRDHILYSKIRPHLNKVVIVDFEGLCSADMYPIKSLIVIEYLFRFMLSPTFVNQATKVEGRVAMPKINQNELNIICVPVPPLEEQQVISDKVAKIFEYCSKLEKQIRTTKLEIIELLSSLLSKLLGNEHSVIIKEENKQANFGIHNIEKKYTSQTTLMELIELLNKHGMLHAEELWKMSKHFDNKNLSESIDKFYADLKQKVEIDKTIKEVDNRKGYLEKV